MTPMRDEIQHELGRVRFGAGLTRQRLGNMQDAILHKMSSAFQESNDVWQKKAEKERK